jgi:hypothetical protein
MHAPVIENLVRRNVGSSCDYHGHGEDLGFEQLCWLLGTGSRFDGARRFAIHEQGDVRTEYPWRGALHAWSLRSQMGHI